MTARKTRPQSKPSGLREALASKHVRTAHWDVPLVDTETTARAAAALRDAKQTQFMAALGDNAELKIAADQVLEQAQAALDACAYRIELQAVLDVDRDALRNEYPEDESLTLLSDPYSYALLAASVVNGDELTAQDWRTQMSSDRWRDADRVELLSLVIDVNYRAFSHGIPKG